MDPNASSQRKPRRALRRLIIQEIYMAYRIHFTPQAWLNDNAISVDNDGDS